VRPQGSGIAVAAKAHNLRTLVMAMAMAMATASTTGWSATFAENGALASAALLHGRLVN